MVTALFDCGDYARTIEIWQWDYGQVLRIQGLSLPTATEIHFALQETGGTSITRIGVTKDGVTDVVIPDSLLDNDGTAQRYSIYAFIYLANGDSGQTIKKITIPVKSRPKPQPFDTPEDAQLFREAIKAVNDAADQAGASEKLAEGWAHGREDMPERAQDNAMYYAGKASEDARQTAADRETVKEMVETVKGYAGKAQTAAKEAAKSQEASEGAAAAAGDSAAAAELSGRQAGQYAADAAQSASDASDSADQASSHATKAGQAYTSTVELAGRAQTVITQTGEDQVQAINTAGATQVQIVKSEGAKQVQAVQDAAQEIAADREQIKTNKEDIATLKSDKVDKDQGADNAGKVLGIGTDGQVTPVEMSGGDVTIDQLLPLAIKATSDKAEILDITDSADFKMQGFNLYGRTEQVQTDGYNLWPMFKDAELSGVKLTVNKDGSVTLNGTCTRSDLFYMIIPVYPMAYTLSCDYTGVLPQNENVRCQIYAPDNTPGETSIRNDAKPDAKAVVTFEKNSDAYFRIRIEAGHTYNNVTMRPMLHYGVDAKPFEPFTGGFPSLRPQMRSRNLFDISSVIETSNIKKTEDSIIVTSYGALVLANDEVRKIFPLGSTIYFKFHAKRMAEITDEGYIFSNGDIGFLIYNVTLNTTIANMIVGLKKDETEKFIQVTADIAEDAYSEKDTIRLLAYSQRYVSEGNANKFNTWEFSDIMISEKDIPYEPYLIPQWPQPINHAGRLNGETKKYEVGVKLTGKNLFDIRKAAVRDNWEPHINLSGYYNYPVFVGKGGKVTISYPEKLPTGHGMYLSICLSDTGDRVGWLAHSTNTGLNNTQLSYTATTDYIYLNAHTDTIANLDRYFSDLQIEYGDIATAFQPYKEQMITLTSDRPITKWDYLDRRDGVWGWVYKGKSKVIDGTETFLINNADTYIGNKTSNVFMIIGDIVSANYNEQNGYCNKLKYVPLSWVIDKDGQIGFCYNAKQIHLRLDNYCTGALKTDTKETVIEKITNYLKAEYDNGSPYIFWYETESDIFTPLPDAEQQALNALVTYYPTTIITNNANAQMQAQYVADPANYIANHYVSKEDTQTIMQRISNIETAMLKL